MNKPTGTPDAPRAVDAGMAEAARGWLVREYADVDGWVAEGWPERMASFAAERTAALQRENAALKEQLEKAEDRTLAMECFLTCAQVEFDEHDDPVLKAEDIDLQITMGWRQHCSNGEKDWKTGEPRKDYLDYGMGYKDGYAAGIARAALTGETGE
jgi:hypothetical protein